MAAPKQDQCTPYGNHAPVLRAANPRDFCELDENPLLDGPLERSDDAAASEGASKLASPLYRFYGIRFSMPRWRFAPEAPVTADKKPWLHLILSPNLRPKVRALAQIQFHLPELFSGRVVQLVPRDRYPALDRHFPSLTRHDEKLSALAVRLAQLHKLRLGDVVQLSIEEVLTLNGNDHASLMRLEELLGEFGLRLGMSAPHWRSPGGLLSACW